MNMNILVADDNTDNLYQLQTLLSGNGFTVVTAANGAEALEKARQTPPDLIMSDVLMPTMDGFTLCRNWMQDARLKNIPFVFYTATYTDESDRDFALSLGAQRFIVKPEEPDVFVRTIREVIENVASAPPGTLTPPASPTPPQAPGATPQEEETGYLRQYSGVLVRKLGKKIEELQITRLALERDIADRKRAEEALRASETQYRKIFDVCPDGILFADIETKAFSSANPALCRMLGYTEAELTKMGMADIHPKESLAHVAAEFERQARGEKTLAVEIPCRRKDGTVIYADINTASVTVHGRTYNEGFFRDVTDRKRAEAALSASEVRYRRLFESAREGILIVDAVTGTIVDVNPFLIDLLGYSREQFLSKKVWELGFLKNVIANPESVLEFQRQEYVHYEDFPLKTADGRRIDVEFISNTYIVDRKKVIQCIVRDITERRRSEKEIRTLAKFPSENPGPVLRIARDGTLLYVNEAGMRLLPDWRLQVERPAPGMLQEVVFSALRSKTVQEVEIEHGGRVYLFHVAPIAEDNYANLYGRDITERKRVEEEMRFKNAILSTQQEVSIDGILVVDEDGAIVSSNRRFAEMWGIPSDVIESKSDDRVLQSVMDKLADPVEFMTKVKRLYESRDETSREEVALKDGRTFDRYSAPMLGTPGKYYG
ncbi:PAS domain S-box protein [Candidatus Sumerlaeota bacterium]|nr:PAS domain S-box protein [Candidatus Sumerlaeota bacterium]